MNCHTSSEILEQEKTKKKDSEKLRILYVEDDPNDQIILRRSLEKRLKIDFSLITVGTGVEGLKKIEENGFDLIFSDYRLPHMTGLEFLKELRKKDSETPFILVTGKGNEKIAVEAMKHGAKDYIVKDDVDSHHLIKAINNLILESVLPKELNRETVKHIFALFSTSPTISVEILTTVKSKPESKLPLSELVPTLKKLAETGFLESKPSRSVVICPYCESLTSIANLQCPECKGIQLVKGDTLEHFSCGNVDFRFKFNSGKSDLVCPKCGKELRQIGVDYRKAGSWYKCSNDHLFTSPIWNFECAKCSKEFNLDVARLEMLHQYQLTASCQRQLRFGLMETNLLET